MFGPNVKANSSNIYYHHREESFHHLMFRIEEAFRNCFGLDDYDLLFVTGSGTLVNEIIIFSCKYEFTVYHNSHEFGKRLEWMTIAHKRIRSRSDIEFVAYPMYETSISHFNNYPSPEPFSRVLFLDMISAFPYYMPPSGVDIWTTVSSKQLGAFPVLGIIGIRKELPLDNFFGDYPRSVLNLKDYLRFAEKKETPATAAIPLYEDLLNCLIGFDRDELVETIESRREKIINIIGEEHIMGQGPVITFNESLNLGKIPRDFDLYKSDSHSQVFLWTGTDSEYTQLYEALERAVK